MKKILTTLIIFYKKLVDLHFFGYRYTPCMFYPSCSSYGYDAITKYGTLKGGVLLVRRICRCHPWQKNTIDPLV